MIENMAIYLILAFIALVVLSFFKNDDSEEHYIKRSDDKVIEVVARSFMLVDKRG